LPSSKSDEKKAKKEAELAVKDKAKREAEEAKKAEEAEQPAEKEAELAAEEKAGEEAKEAKKAEEAEQPAKKEAEIATKEKAKRETGEARKATSAEKQMRAAGKRQLRNKSVRSLAKTNVTKAEKLIFSGELEAAREAVVATISSLDKAAEKGIIHPNNAARRKSRLMKKLNEAQALSSAEAESKEAG